MRITLEIEDAEPGTSVTVTVDGITYHDLFDPDPEEKPEEEKKTNIRAVGEAA